MEPHYNYFRSGLLIVHFFITNNLHFAHRKPREVLEMSNRGPETYRYLSVHFGTNIGGNLKTLCLHIAFFCELLLTSSCITAQVLLPQYSVWEGFAFGDKHAVESRKTEDWFARFLIDVVWRPHSDQVEQVQNLLSRAEQAGCMERFMQLAEKYLYEPNSPYYNEGLYVVFLLYVVEHGDASLSDFAKYKHHYELIAKNQVGSRASDFSFAQQNGLRGTLYGIESNYTVLFFNDPTCQECNQAKRQLENNYATFEQKGIRVVAVYIDSEVAVWKKAVYHTSWLSVYAEDVDRKQLYNVRALPTLYLLDKQKRVLLKDVSVEKLIKYLEMI